ncbi:hypothetical protein Anas_07008 [Armadillidium nasatum]|uniref:Uncharacterized protein n=1 Tax=Armadillidium nasatum TaxID=96803 RepID=A0A5N5T2Y4_9CRUS|nr:hypothetical protein Anas_07008 [Armadillidium nasatum]
MFKNQKLRIIAYLYVLFVGFSISLEPVTPSKNLPLIYSFQPKFYIPHLPHPLSWRPFTAFHSKAGATCKCEQKPVIKPLNSNCPDSQSESKNDERILKCAKLKGIYCDHNDKCYTRAIRGPNYVESQKLCHSLQQRWIYLQHLLKEQDLTEDIVKSFATIYNNLDEEFWPYDDTITEDSLKCPSLKIDFNALTWTK